MLIIASEVSSQKAYTARFQSPVWPQGMSGVTIGIGYDIGASSSASFEEDWKSYLPVATLDALRPACGRTGNAARSLISSLRLVRISWEVALAQYEGETLPRYIGETERAIPNTPMLSADSLGALVSLVYNRGTSFRLQGSRFKEMRDLWMHMSERSFHAVPDDILSMKRLWEGQPSFRGLEIRRQAEASLFELGLSR